MNPREAMTRQVRAALEREARINIHNYPVAVDSQDGIVTLEGEVPDIAAKKLALEAAASAQGVSGVLDRLRVAPAQRRGDGAIRDSLARLLLEQREFARCTIRTRVNRKVELHRDVDREGVGSIEAAVAEGVIVLEGSMISQPHRLFAGVVAWWTPGVRDVLNAIEVQPEYEERDEEVTETLRLVLEADPLLDADRIRPRCERWIVTLDGAVPTEGQRRRAELDAWCLSGVDRVVNRLQVAG